MAGDKFPLWLGNGWMDTANVGCKVGDIRSAVHYNRSAAHYIRSTGDLRQNADDGTISRVTVVDTVAAIKIHLERLT